MVSLVTVAWTFPASAFASAAKAVAVRPKAITIASSRLAILLIFFIDLFPFLLSLL